MKWWPETPEDSKSLLLSVVAGLAVAIILLTHELLMRIFNNSIGILIGTYAALWYGFYYFLIRYKELREGMDDIEVKTKKVSKKKYK